METPGLIKDKVDLKILILYVLRKLPAPVDSELLYEICLCDNGVEYFPYSECLADLVESGHITEVDDELVISEKGRRNIETLESSLPYSVRNAADRLAEPAAEMLSRYSLIRAEQVEEKNGISVHLSLSDGEYDLLDLKLYCGDEEKAKKIRKNFRRNAEKIYIEMIHSFSEEKKRN